MPSTNVTGMPPHSVYMAPLSSAEQTLIWSSGSYAEFQDGSQAIARSGSKLIARSGAKVDFQSGSSIVVGGNLKHNVTRLTSNALNTVCIKNNGVYILATTENQVYKLEAPTSGCHVKIIINGPDTTKCDIAIQATSNKKTINFTTIGQRLVATTKMCKSGQPRWVELIGQSATAWLIASWGPYTSQQVWSISTSTSILKP